MELPVFDLSPYLSAGTRDEPRSGVKQEENGDLLEGLLLDETLLDLCKSLAKCLKETGVLIVRDPRCPSHENERFLDTMESYFGSPAEFKQLHERPDLHYQVGVTPEGIETPRLLKDLEMRKRIDDLPEDARPHIPSGPDPKWRFFWRVGPRPLTTNFEELNAEPVVPEGFPDWSVVMNTWGGKMIAAVETVAEMAAIGFDLPRTTFTKLMTNGPHLLAPTGSNLEKYGKEGTVFAGYHYDLNFLTIHGRSRFPGLFVWLSDGRRIPVSVPEGCLLLQAGKQMEWLTGGACTAGMHEVIVTDRTIRAVDAARKEGRSLWRVSSTVFSHIASDEVLQPVGYFKESAKAEGYPPTYAGAFVKSELAVIKLRS